MDEAIGNFTRFYGNNFNSPLPPAAGPRALLKTRLAEMNTAPEPRVAWPSFFNWRQAAAIFLFVAAFAVTYRYGATADGLRSPIRAVPVTFPEPRLTPGAVLTSNKDEVCKSKGQKNRAVPASVERTVFEEYGIPNAAPQAYEVDYLITPALGGSDDIRNLWPQSYASAVWNAHVKDALEDRLRELVCAGNLDLAAAQHDLSSDWIAAYKKYFQTDQPLESDR
jgi:hypothetical protein